MADIPVNANDAVFTAVITTNGQTLVDFDFLTYDADDIRAVHVSVATGVRTALQTGVDFTVSGVGQENGGTITLMGGAPVTVIGDEVVVYRENIIQRLFDYQKLGDFRAETVNRELDTVFMIMQELRRDIDAAITVPVGDTPPDIDFVLGRIADGEAAAAASEASAAAAAAAAAAVDLPAVIADSVVIGNAAGDERINATFLQARQLLGYFDTQAEFQAARVASAIQRVTVGSGISKHDKIRIATPAPAEPWHSQSLDGAWWEISSDYICAEMLGVSSVSTVNSAIRFSSEKGVPCRIYGGIDCAGQIDTRPDATIEFMPGSVLRQTEFSVTGSFLTNVTSEDADREQSNVTIRNLQLDGANYPAPITLVTAAGSDTTHLVFTAAASAVDDAYNGLWFQTMEGALLVRGTISDYVGATRTATLSAALSGSVVAGVDVRVGYNDNAGGFAWGMENFNIEGGWVRNYPGDSMVYVGAGAKGINFEQGVYNGRISGLKITNMLHGLFLSGKDGTMTTGVSKSNVGNRITGCHIERCGSAITMANLDELAGIPIAGDENQIVVSDITYHNCGHAPWRIVGTDQQKCGIINLMGNNGGTIDNVRGWNDADVITQLGGYPTDYAERVGFGLSGPPGALFWGHARNFTASDVHHHGDLDAVVHIGRGRALGDDAPPSGIITQARGWNMHNINIHGTVDRLVSVDTAIAFDPTQIEGYWNIICDVVSVELVPTSFSTCKGLILDIIYRPSSTRIIGSAADILARGNQIGSFIPEELTDLRTQDRRQFTLADDAFVSFTPLRNNGVIRLSTTPSGVSPSTLNEGQATYTTATAASCVKSYGTNLSVGTTALTAGTGDGVDGNWNIHATLGGPIYIKNRTGATRAFTVVLD